MFDAVSKPTRPVLRYHGGKWTIAPWIISHFPEHRAYVEPFGGAASVLLRKSPSEVEVYNDLSGDLVNLFRVLRDHELSGELIRRLELTPWAYEEWFDATKFEQTSDPIENARRLVVVGFMSIGTDSSAGRRRSGFRSYSRTDKIGTCPVRQWTTLPAALAQVVGRIQGRVIVENRDAAYVMRQHDSETTLHYVDPPYVKSTRGDTGNDYRFEMDDDQHRNLAAVLHGLKGKVVVSGYLSDLYNELFRHWRRVERPHLADFAGKRIEALWLNF